jgi:DNA-binding GntR family transcriptional regulator
LTDHAAEPTRQFRPGSRVSRGARGLADDIAKQIRNGRLTAGSKLPTYFALAEMYHVSLSTVQRAIALLTARGLIRGIQGDGLYVSDNVDS